MKTFIFLLVPFLTAVTTNTRPRRVFSLSKFSWTSISCFHGFLTCSDWEGSLIPEWREKTYKNNRELKMETFSGRRRPDWQRKPGTKAAVAHGSRGRIAKVFRSINSTKRKISHRQGKSFPLSGGCFRNEFCNLQIYLSFFMLSNRIQN